MKEKTINFRIEEDLKKRLKILAKKDKRSLSNYLVLQLEKIAEINEKK
jgi:predicted HicB family RNase H-like nuclease